MEHIKSKIEEIKKELEAQPEDASKLNELGVGYHLIGEYDQAIKVLRIAARLEPQNHQVQFNLGNSFAEKENRTRAMHHLMNAVEIKPDFIPALNNLADQYEQAGETDHARELFEHITEIAPDDAIGFFNLGSFYLRQNDTVNAGKNYQKTIDRDPQFYEAYNNIGFILKHLERYEDAIPYFERCLSIKPDYEPALRDLKECREESSGL